MKVGIVGFPGSGKTSVFNALTGLHAVVGGYGATGRPNLGTIKVPDPRLDWLSEIFRPKKTCTRRKRRPMTREFRNNSLMSLGVALVATSKSLGVRPSKRSRTQPPTRYAL